MSYTPTTWANGDTITAEKLNKIEQGISTATSGFEYDLIIETITASTGFVPSNLAVTKGNILACEQKVANGEAVHALLVLKEVYSWTVGNINKCSKMFQLSEWFGPYCYIMFGKTTLGSLIDSGPIKIETVCISYDKDTGQITRAARRYYNL